MIDWSVMVSSLREFFLDMQYLNLFGTTIVLFFASFISWYIYSEQLSKKNLFEVPPPSESKYKNFLGKLIYLFKYLIVFPLYAFMWFLIFSFMLSLLSKERQIQDIMFFAIIVVAATRIGAYVSDRLAEDMAKLLPWSLILIFLLDPKSITWQGFLASFDNFYMEVPKVAKYLLFVMAIEWILRLGHWIMHPKEIKEITHY